MTESVPWVDAFLLRPLPLNAYALFSPCECLALFVGTVEGQTCRCQPSTGIHLLSFIFGPSRRWSEVDCPVQRIRSLSELIGARSGTRPGNGGFGRGEPGGVPDRGAPGPGLRDGAGATDEAGSRPVRSCRFRRPGTRVVARGVLGRIRLTQRQVVRHSARREALGQLEAAELPPEPDHRLLVRGSKGPAGVGALIAPHPVVPGATRTHRRLDRAHASARMARLRRRSPLHRDREPADEGAGSR